MQIEQSFRDVKNHQFGLCARDIRTRCVFRWGIKMLLVSIVQLLFWIIGVIGHSQGFQSIFQANTVKDKKVFSYFYLGQLIVEYDKLKEISLSTMNSCQLLWNKSWLENGKLCGDHSGRGSDSMVKSQPTITKF